MSTNKNTSTTTTDHKPGHRRTASTTVPISKAQPVTALLLNFPPQNLADLHAKETRDSTVEQAPIYFELETETEYEENQPPLPPKLHAERLAGKENVDATCLLCTQNAPEHLAGSDRAVNAMCERLCDDKCRMKLSLSGFKPSTKNLAVNSEMLAAATSLSADLADIEKTPEVAATLAKVSAMTSSTHIKQRLAARKLEIELDQQQQQQLQTADSVCANKVKNLLKHNNNNNENYNQMSNVIDIESDFANNYIGNECEPPPREILLYLVRMGSFNSAPKITNIDSQDDGLEIPKGLSVPALLQHVKCLRGERQLPILRRKFTTPPSVLVNNDLTDGLRCLKIDALSRGCCMPLSSPNYIRLLQWNMLSQTLGQSNDNFVCCPDEALTWEYRKFMIVEEILQHMPDIICLQEVDHYKFLHNILSTVNYDGVFFPKPDSPCLYVEDNNGPDGCAIFYRRDRFEVKSCETRILEVWRVPSNQVAIAMNLSIKGLDREICVATTHLKARSGTLLAKLRNEQGRDLLNFVKNFAGSERPIILCGDFNAEPNEPIYSTILQCKNLNLGSAYADWLIEQNDKEISQPGDEKNISAEQSVQSSMHHEPPYTTWKIRENGEECHTIDYVFYTKQNIKVRNCLEFPNDTEIGKYRTPSFRYPSDHFSLVCDLEILEQAQK